MIWAFFTRRFRLWLLFAFGVPLVRRLLGQAGETLEARNGPTALTRGLRTGHQSLERFDRRARRDARRGRTRPARR